MDGTIRVKLSIDALRNKSLSILVREFEKFNGNTHLIESIHKLIPKRNHIAHAAFYGMYLHAEEGKDLGPHIHEAIQVGNEAAKCIELLHKEIDLVEGLCQKEGIMALE